MFVNVLNFIASNTSGFVIGTTVVEVYVTTQCLTVTEKMAHPNWGNLVICGESSAFDLEHRSIFGAIYGPPRARHEAMTCSMYLLGMIDDL